MTYRYENTKKYFLKLNDRLPGIKGLLGPFPAHVTGQAEIISFDAVPKQLDSHFRVREGLSKQVSVFTISCGF